MLLNEAGRPRFLECYHRALDTEFQDRETGERTTFRGLLLRQARRMRGVLLGEADYQPFLDR